MCECLATSQEHAPPKCIFPEQKDTGGIDYRKGLIKVPSCEVHNSAKSSDDEYLMYVLPTSIASNSVGINQFLTKIKRGISRNPSLAANLVTNAQKVTVHDTKKDVWFEATAIQINMERVRRVIEMNARAIYYHERKMKFTNPIKVLTNFSLKFNDPKANDLQEKIFDMSEFLLKNAEAKGANSDVFAYKMTRASTIEIIEFTYYGTSKALAFLQHD